MRWILFDRWCVRSALWVGLLGMAVLLGACSTLDVPRAENYPATDQKKARAVHHWDVLADDVAQRIAAKLVEWPTGEHPIHVRLARDSSFEQGFGKLLVIRLLERGVTVSTQPTEVELLVQTQVVEHKAGVRNSLLLPWTRLAAGVAVVRDWQRYVQTSKSVISSGLALGLATDVAEMHTQGVAAGGPTRTEVLITATLQSAGRYLTGSADVYYVEPEDATLYLPPPAPLPPTPIKTWKVVTP